MSVFGLSAPSLPSLPSLSDVRNAVGQGLNNARDFGASAVQRASDLGQAGLDLGRKAIADPEGAVRSVAAATRQGLHDGAQVAQQGVRDGVMWSGRQIQAGAEAARDAIPGDNIVSNTLRAGITQAETQSRFSVGVVGGVLNEGVGLLDTAGTLSVYAAELQVSPTARAELGQTVLGGLERGGNAVLDYGQAVANDPSRVLGDVSGAATATWDATAGFVGGQIQRHEDAIARGEGPETIGMTTGQVATYLVPIGGGPLRGAATAGVRGATEVAAREGAEALVREGVEATAREGVEAVTRESAEAAVRALPQATRADLDAFRARLGVAETQTVAAARTDIPGLEGRLFEGASPKVMKEAGLPQPPAGPISAPFNNPLFVRHAEERVSNALANAIDALPAGTDLAGKTVSIHVSQAVCSACKAGLRDSEAATGVLKQLSERYPDLTIRVTTEASDSALTLRGGVTVDR
jgi:filamentous hemagglutinin